MTVPSTHHSLLQAFQRLWQELQSLGAERSNDLVAEMVLEIFVRDAMTKRSRNAANGSLLADVAALDAP